MMLITPPCIEWPYNEPAGPFKTSIHSTFAKFVLGALLFVVIWCLSSLIPSTSWTTLFVPRIKKDCELPNLLLGLTPVTAFKASDISTIFLCSIYLRPTLTVVKGASKFLIFNLLTLAFFFVLITTSAIWVVTLCKLIFKDSILLFTVIFFWYWLISYSRKY